MPSWSCQLISKRFVQALGASLAVPRAGCPETEEALSREPGTPRRGPQGPQDEPEALGSGHTSGKSHVEDYNLTPPASRARSRASSPATGTSHRDHSDPLWGPGPQGNPIWSLNPPPWLLSVQEQTSGRLLNLSEPQFPHRKAGTLVRTADSWGATESSWRHMCESQLFANTRQAGQRRGASPAGLPGSAPADPCVQGPLSAIVCPT